MNNTFDQSRFLSGCVCDMRVRYPFRDGLLIVCRQCRVLERLGFDRFQGVVGRGWGCGEGERWFLWAVGFQENVRDFIEKYGAVVT